MKGLYNFLVVPISLGCNAKDFGMLLNGIIVFNNPVPREYSFECDCVLNINGEQQSVIFKPVLNPDGCCFKMTIDVRNVQHCNFSGHRVFTVKGDLKAIHSQTHIPKTYARYITKTKQLGQQFVT